MKLCEPTQYTSNDPTGRLTPTPQLATTGLASRHKASSKPIQTRSSSIQESPPIRMGASENRGPLKSTLNSRILIIRTPKQGTPNFRKLPYGPCEATPSTGCPHADPCASRRYPAAASEVQRRVTPNPKPSTLHRVRIPWPDWY